MGGQIMNIEGKIVVALSDMPIDSATGKGCIVWIIPAAVVPSNEIPGIMGATADWRVEYSPSSLVGEGQAGITQVITKYLHLFFGGLASNTASIYTLTDDGWVGLYWGAPQNEYPGYWLLVKAKSSTPQTATSTTTGTIVYSATTVTATLGLPTTINLASSTQYWWSAALLVAGAVLTTLGLIPTGKRRKILRP